MLGEIDDGPESDSPTHRAAKKAARKVAPVTATAAKPKASKLAMRSAPF
jgi:hypothetical protein